MKIKKVISILVSSILLVGVVGCSNEVKNSNGGYIESDFKGPENIEVNSLTLLEDNKIGLAGYSNETLQPRAFLSEDGGLTWKSETIKIPKEEGNSMVASIEYLENGSIFLESKIQKPMAEKDLTKVNFEDIEWENKYYIIDKDGNSKSLEIDFSLYNDSEEESQFKDYIFKFNKKGDIFFSLGTENNKIVEINGKTLEEKKVHELSDNINDFIISGKSLIVDLNNEIVEYDIETGKEKGTLELVEENMIKGFNNLILIDSGSSDKIYYYDKVGVYEYNRKNKGIKQIIDSSLSSFGHSNMRLKSFIKKENGEYLTLFTDMANFSNESHLSQFTYTDDLEALQKDKLVIYSLIESEKIRSQIADYVDENPDTYVKYEVGLGYGYGRTQTDAIKALNTEIMAGNGPDLIILDGLKADSYIEKGLLEDLSDIVNPLISEGQVFENIAEAFKVDNKIYQIPISFKYPIIVGQRELIEAISDLDSLVEVTKKFSQEKERLTLSYLYSASPKYIFYGLHNLYGNDWINEDQTINEEALSNFFIKVKEMYLALRENRNNYQAYISNKYSELNESTELIAEEEVVIEGDFESIEMFYSLNPGIYLSTFLFSDESLIELGVIKNSHEYKNLITLLNMKPDMDYKVLSKGNDNIFSPQNLIALNAKGKNKDKAKELLNKLITSTNEFFEIYSSTNEGMYTSTKLFEDTFVEVKEENFEFSEEKNHYIYGKNFQEDGYGNVSEIEILQPNEEDINRLKGEIGLLNKATKIDVEIIREISNRFADYVNDEKSLEDSISEIKNNLDLYLAE